MDHKSSKEAKRVEALRKLNLMDTPPEERFDRICRVASKLLQTPIAYVSLLDDDTQFFKAAVGLGDITHTERADSFCTHTIERENEFYVPDATDDDRFRNNPYVQGPPGVRCYLGEPLFSTDGHAVGTFCILDTQPRELDPEMRRTFRDLASLAERELNLLAQLHQQRKLTELSSHLVSSLDQNQIAETLLGVLRDSIQLEQAAVAIKEGDCLRIASAIGAEPPTTIFDSKSPPPSCFGDGKAHTVCLSIDHQGMNLGMLWVERSGSPFTTMEQELISSFVLHAGLILENRAILANLFEQSRLVSLGSLAAGVAHEINSPLGAARLNVESAILLAPDNEKLTKRLHRVNRALEKASNIIKGVLQYAGEGPNVSSFSVLDEVLGQTLTLVNHDLQALKVNYETDLAAQDCVVPLGQKELQTVLHHLIQNAAWAAQQPAASSHKIEIETRKENSNVFFTITDLGPGVDQEIAGRIFDPFVTTKEPGQGVGLGLSVSKKLAEGAGGDLILLPSESGARFQLVLPLCE